MMTPASDFTTDTGTPAVLLTRRSDGDPLDDLCRLIDDAGDAGYDVDEFADLLVRALNEPLR